MSQICTCESCTYKRDICTCETCTYMSDICTCTYMSHICTWDMHIYTCTCTHAYIPEIYIREIYIHVSYMYRCICIYTYSAWRDIYIYDMSLCCMTSAKSFPSLSGARHSWVMSHIRGAMSGSHVTHKRSHVRESCHTLEEPCPGVMSHIRGIISHTTGVVSHIGTSHATRADGTCHTYREVLSHIDISHIWMLSGTHRNESCQTNEGDMYTCCMSSATRFPSLSIVKEVPERIWCQRGSRAYLERCLRNSCHTCGESCHTFEASCHTYE